MLEAIEGGDTMEAYRASLLHFLDDPDRVGVAPCHEYFEDGLLLVEDGRVVAAGEAATLLPRLAPHHTLTDYRGHLILPGFVDTHTHYPQFGIMGASGLRLLDWLQQQAFPAEARFADYAHAADVAQRFLAELLRCGTTTAMVFATVHPASVEAFFEAAAARRMRMICGKVLMDRHAPPELCDSAESGYRDSKALIERWHGRGRLRYAVTPRFALSCSEAQLALAGALLQEHPGLHLQTHLAESPEEVAHVHRQFPGCDNYLDCYTAAGLVQRRSTFAHCIHLEAAEWQQLAASGAGIAFCPASNLVLGSGRFRLEEAVKHGIRVGLGTDIGAGNSVSLLSTLADACKCQQSGPRPLAPFKAFYLATLGGAECLDCAGEIGNFQPGKEADFVVIDPGASRLMAYRQTQCRDLGERLSALAMLGDDRHVTATYVLGQPAWQRPLEAHLC